MDAPLETGPNTVRVEFIPTVDEHLAAVRAAGRTGHRKQWWLLAMLAVIGINVAISIATGGPGALRGMAGMGVLAVCVAAAAWLAVPVLFRRAVVRQLAANPEHHDPLAYAFDADGMRVESSRRSTTVPWTSFTRARELKDVFLFHIGEGTVYFLPRRAFREDDEVRLRALVAAHLGPRAEFMNPTDGR